MAKPKKDWSDDFVYHWKYFEVPSRPSPSDIEFIKKKILGKGRNAKILILGATPEYRNLCGELGISVTLMDFSRKNYDYLSDEVKNKPKEIFIEGNWLSKALDEKFDIILGDNVINVIAKEDVPKLLSNAAKMLKKDGFFMPRTYVRDRGERYTGEKVIKEYRTERKGQSLFTGTMRNFLVAAYDFDEERVIFSDIRQLVKELHNKGIMSDEEVEEYENFSLDRDFRIFIPLREDIDMVFSGLFEIKEIFYGAEKYLKNQLPLYVLGRKQDAIE